MKYNRRWTQMKKRDITRRILKRGGGESNFEYRMLNFEWGKEGEIKPQMNTDGSGRRKTSRRKTQEERDWEALCANFEF